MRFLTQEWLDESRALTADQPVRADVTATIQHVVTGGPDGTVRWYAVIQDGEVTELAVGDAEDPDITLTLTYDDAVRVQRGQLDPNVAFMRGAMKSAGDMEQLFRLLPLFVSPEHRALQERIRAVTDY